MVMLQRVTRQRYNDGGVVVHIMGALQLAL